METSNLDLHKAVFNNDVEKVKELIESKECDINQRDKFGKINKYASCSYILLNKFSYKCLMLFN